MIINGCMRKRCSSRREGREGEGMREERKGEGGHERKGAPPATPRLVKNTGGRVLVIIVYESVISNPNTRGGRA